MNRFHLPPALVEQLGWVLVHSVWQLALIALVTLVLCWAMRRASARARYAVLLVALTATTLAPLATLLALPLPQPALVLVPGKMISVKTPGGAALSIEAGPTIVFPDAPSFPDGAPAVARPPVATPRPVPVRFRDLFDAARLQVEQAIAPRLDWIVGLWCLGVCLFALRPAIGIREIRRLRRLGVSPVADNVAALLNDLARRMGLARPVAVLQSDRAHVPLVMGHLRPLILLPLSLVSQMPVAQLEAILAHELAHVRRHDYLVNLWQTLVETVLFYHPAVWWLSRRIRQERENCCDDLAVAVVENRVEYGRALLAVAQLQAHPAALALGVRGGSLPARIARLFPGQRGSHAIDSGNLVALALLATWIVSVAVWATAVAQAPHTAETKESPVPERVLHFPADRAMGIVYFRESNEAGYAVVAPKEWNRVGEARGAVRVPAGKEIRLDLSIAASRDLSGLDGLQPDDLALLNCRDTDVGDDSLEHIGRLSGLVILDLDQTRITDEGFQQLAGLTRLRSVNLDAFNVNREGFGVGDASLQVLARFPDLEAIRLRDTKVTGAGLAALAPLKSLSRLDLSGTKIGDAGLTHLKQLPSLTMLHLGVYGTGAEITDEGLKTVGELANLTYLTLSGNRISDAGLVHLKNLARLEDLSLDDTGITENGLVNLEPLQALQNLRLFTGHQITDVGAAHLAKLKSLRRLTDDVTVTEAGLTSLASLPHLERLMLLNTKISAEGAKQIAGMKSLRWLHFRKCPIDDDELPAICDLPNLDWLNLSETRVSGDGLKNLARLPKLSTLSLDFGDRDEQPAASRPHLREVAKLSRLTDLRLHGWGLDSNDLEAIAGMMSLEELDVGFPVDDQGALQIAGLRNLTNLQIYNGVLTDAGMRYLSKLRQLTFLNLTGHFSDRGLESLTNLKLLSGFQVHSPYITKAGLRALERQLPALQFCNAWNDPNEQAKADAPATVEFYIGESEPGPGLKEARVEGQDDDLIYLSEKPVLTREDIAESRVVGDNNRPAVDVVFTEAGKTKIAQATEKNLGKRFAVVVSGKVVFAATIRSTISDRAQITIGTKATAEKLVQAISPAPEGPKRTTQAEEATREALERLKQLGAEVAERQPLPEGTPEEIGRFGCRIVFPDSWHGTDADWRLLEAIDHPERLMLSVKTDHLAGLANVRLAHPLALLFLEPDERRVGQLDRLPACREVTLNDNLLSLDGYRKLFSLIPATARISLKGTLPFNDGRPKNDDIIAELTSRLPHLVSLHVGCQLSPVGLKAVGKLADLKELQIAVHASEPADVEALAQVKDLKKLVVTCTKTSLPPWLPVEVSVGDAIARIAAEISTLRSLYIGVGTPVSRNGLEAIAKLAGLEHLRVELTEVDDQSLAPIGRLVGLRTLWVGGGGKLSDAGPAQLKELSLLTHLALPGNGLTDAALSRLAPLTSLKSFALRGGRFTDGGLAALEPLKHLDALDLSNWEFDDDGCRLLPEFAPQLVALDLNEAKVTDAGLAELARLKNLARLRVTGTVATPQGLVALRSALPQLVVVDDASWRGKIAVFSPSEASERSDKPAPADGKPVPEPLTELQSGLAATRIRPAEEKENGAKETEAAEPANAQPRRNETNGEPNAPAGDGEPDDDAQQIVEGQTAMRVPHFIASDKDISLGQATGWWAPGSAKQQAALRALRKLGVMVSFYSSGRGVPSISPVYNTLRLELRFTSSWHGKADDWKLLEALDHPDQVLLWLMETADLSGLARVKTARPFGEIWALAAPTVKLARLDRMPPCRWLNIDDDELMPADYTKLIALAADVEELTVPWRQHDEIADAVVAEIATKMKHLVRLELMRPLSAPGIQSVARLTGLRHLMTRTAKIAPADVEPLAGLTHLETLYVLPPFGEPERADRRRELPIGDALARVAARLPQLRVLTQRTLVGPQGVKSLAGAKNLLALDAELAEVDDRTLSVLAGMTQLHRLQLAGEGKLSPAGLANVAGLRRLTDLALPGQGLTDESLEHLRPLTRLKRLSLRRGTFDGTGFNGLTGSDDGRPDGSPAFLARLSELDISDSQVNDDGCRALAEMPGLTCLYLEDDKITDVGMAEFKTGKSQSILLYLAHTAVTPQGVAALHAARPGQGVDVYYDDDQRMSRPWGVWSSFDASNQQPAPDFMAVPALAAGAAKPTEGPPFAAAPLAPDETETGRVFPVTANDWGAARALPGARPEDMLTAAGGSEKQQAALAGLQDLVVNFWPKQALSEDESDSPADRAVRLEIRFGNTWRRTADPWKLLAALDHPEQIRLELENFDAPGLSRLKTARPLAVIRLPGTSHYYVQDESQIKEIAEHPQWPKSFSKLDRLPACRALWVDVDRLTPADLPKLIALAADVEELTLHSADNTKSGDAVAAEIAAKVKHLTRLELSWPLSRPGIESVARLTGLEHLSISMHEIEPADVEPLGKLTHLETLKIDAMNSADERAADAMARVVSKIPSLRRLSVLKTRLTARGLAAIATAEKLQALEVEVAEVDDGALATVSRLSQLRRLHLAGEGKLTQEGFAPVGQLRLLTDLELPGAGLTDKSLESLRPLTELKRLVLPRGFIAGPGLAGAVPDTADPANMPPRWLAALEELDVSDSVFSDDGCAVLARQCPKLRFLDLSRTQVTDVGMKSLAKLTNLRNVILDGTKITDFGLAYLKGLENLMMVHTRNTAVTPEAAAALFRAPVVGGASP